MKFSVVPLIKVLALDKPASILVVDDDESNRESLRRRLERRGYTAAVAVDGRDALEKVAGGSFDLVILDVMMPGINGLEVLDILRKTYAPSRLPIIMATARDQSEDVVEALDRGANDYVTKPLDFAVVNARVRTHLQLKQSVDQIIALEASLQARNDELKKSAERTARELNAAAKVQQAFLPHANPHVTGARFSWIFEPCTELAGDSLNVVQLDDRHVALYVLDVSGHGVAASLLAVTVTRLLSPSSAAESFVMLTNADQTRRPAAPSDVATRLTRNFLFDSTDQFITLFYAVYDTVERELTYVSAGHPGAIRVSPAKPPVILNGTGLPIGIGESYEQQTIRLESGDRLYLYSDGVTEAMDSNRELFGLDQLIGCLQNTNTTPLTESISRVQTAVASWQAGAASRDDMSILGMECT
jgi:sigma-B regulation protein RsbU (phosphoserine phosphatase)